jgi:hypothetical protein
MLRPIVLGSPGPVLEAKALYNYNLVEPTAPTGSPTGGWDSDKWDVAVWGGDYTSSSGVQGACGMGRDVAIAVRGAARSRTVLVGVDVMFDQGGVLG